MGSVENKRYQRHYTYNINSNDIVLPLSRDRIVRIGFVTVFNLKTMLAR